MPQESNVPILQNNHSVMSMGAQSFMSVTMEDGEVVEIDPEFEKK